MLLVLHSQIREYQYCFLGSLDSDGVVTVNVGNYPPPPNALLLNLNANQGLAIRLRSDRTVHSKLLCYSRNGRQQCKRDKQKN